MNSTTNSPEPVRRGQRQLVGLAALFFVPLAVAFWLYYGTAGWQPEGGTNNGDLIEPARPLPDVSLPAPDGAPVGTDVQLRGKWTMLYIGDGNCDGRCQKALYLMRQSRIALNKDFDRIQRVFLATGPCCDLRYLSDEHPDLLIAGLTGPDAERLLATFPSYDGVDVADAGRIYLVDPLGNLMMSYSEQAPDKALLKDLKKLLRLSHIG
jgi:cytochrome oxidase Cu insertion factor (SCO1/SenC/PrrC family)